MNAQRSRPKWARALWPAALIAASTAAATAQATVHYVDAHATGAGDGTSWDDAFTDLQHALDAATAGNEIWVAAGTYVPSGRTEPDLPRSATFQLIDGVALYGGFAGYETDPNQRDWLANETILNGDLNGDDGPDFTNRRDNACHVVLASDTSPDTVLDGLVITAGHANLTMSGLGQHLGGGLFAEHGSPTISNCTFVANSGFLGAGMMAVGWYAHEPSNPTLTNCVFWNNRTTLEGDGGGLYVADAGDPLIIDCAFIENFAGDSGGAVMDFTATGAVFINCVFSGNRAGATDSVDDLAIGGAVFSAAGGDGWASVFVNCTFTHNKAIAEDGFSAGGALLADGDVELINCTLADNLTSGFGGAIHTYWPGTSLTNCILWGNADQGGASSGEFAQIFDWRPSDGPTVVNYSCVQGWTGWFGGQGNHGLYPRFVRDPDGDYGDLHLQLGSPCLDAGDSGALPPDWGDLDDDGNLAETTPLDLDFNPRLVDDPEAPDVGVPGPGGLVVDMGAYEGGVACEPGPCSDGDPCTVNDQCVDGVCVGSPVPNCIDCLSDDDCSDGVACTEDTCLDGECVSTPDDGACPNDGLYCTGSSVCRPPVGCVAIPPPCPDGLVCDEATETCLACVDNDDCSDGVACTVDTCLDGECVSTPDDGACPDDGLYCNGIDVCDPDVGCVETGSPCTNGLACHEDNDTCGECLSDGDCDDGLFCNGLEMCDPSLGCISTGPPCAEGERCDEGNDRCAECFTPADCDDGVDCTSDTCVDYHCVFTPRDGACPDDGLFCNGVDVCDPDVGCVETGSPCTNGLACHEDNDTCGECTEGGECDDGLFCTGPEICDPNIGCVSAGDPCPADQWCNEATDRCVECLTDAHCDDGVNCTYDVCVRSQCRFRPADWNCPDDGLFCNGRQICDALEGCVPAGDPCPSGSTCNEAHRRCDLCLAHADCDDGTDCTKDACVGGRCVATPDDTLCPDDGRYCNGREICASGEGCTSSGNPCPGELLCDEDNDICADCLGDHQCDDGIDCTDDACIDGECVFQPDDEACPDDGLYCNGAEVCNPAGGCVSAGNPCPSVLVCDEEQDRCTICLEDIDCNDRDPCTVDTCIDQSCEHDPIPGCDQGSFVSRDEDNDGVLNWDDFCPNTPPDTPVDGRGCPLEPPGPAARKGERGYDYEPESGASVGRGTGACGALGLIPALFGLAGLRLMRSSRRRPRVTLEYVPNPPSRGLQPARRLKHEGLRTHP